jgi:hypothetical protein
VGKETPADRKPKLSSDWQNAFVSKGFFGSVCFFVCSASFLLCFRAERFFFLVSQGRFVSRDAEEGGNNFQSKSCRNMQKGVLLFGSHKKAESQKGV